MFVARPLARLVPGAAFAALLAAPALAAAQTPAPPLPAARRAPSAAAARPIQLRWIGHATFEIVSSGGTRLLIDPWLANNPAAPDSLKGVQRYTGATRPAAILVTHSHFDHSQDVKAVAQASGAPVISNFEWVNTLQLPEAQAMGGNPGGKIRVGDVTVHLVPAVHSSEPSGRPLGFVLEFADGRTLYHTGDTWVFSDMEHIQARYRPSIILLNVGGGPYGQDPETAAYGVRRYFRPATIVPMHFATFPALSTEAQVRAAFAGDRRLAVMRPGELREF